MQLCVLMNVCINICPGVFTHIDLFVCVFEYTFYINVNIYRSLNDNRMFSIRIIIIMIIISIL